MRYHNAIKISRPETRARSLDDLTVISQHLLAGARRSESE